MEFEKEKSWFRRWNRCVSLRVPVGILLLLFGLIPMILGIQTVLASYRQVQIESRMTEVQNQCQILTKPLYLCIGKALKVA